MNKDKRNNIQLLGTLNNADESGIIANASQIYDANENKSTQDVSKEHTERIKTLEDKENELIAAVGTGGSVDTRITNAVNVEKTRAEGAESTLDGKITAEQTRAANAENALDGRVDTLEEAVGTGGSVDSKIASAVATETSRAQEAEANRYTKNETYTKEEVNNLITTPNQEYVSVTATDQTTAVTDVLPAIGLANTVYRVGSWDGSQYDVTKYSEYAWNGKDYVHLSTKTGEASAASNVAYNHNDSKLDATNVQQAIDEVRRRSNYNDGDNIIDFNTIHLITDNPEFICVAVDANDKILYGIKTDGQPYFGVGCPQQVKDYIDKQINKILGTDDITTTIDSLKEIEAFLKDFTNSDTLKKLLDLKANVDEVKATTDDIYKKSNPNDSEGNVVDTNTIISVEDNPEYIQALTDSVGKLIEAIGIDGIRKFFAGINIQGISQCVIDNPDYTIAWVDKENRIIFAIQHDGNPYFGYGVPKQITDEIKRLLGNINSDVEDDLRSVGYFPSNVLQQNYYDDSLTEKKGQLLRTDTIIVNQGNIGSIYGERDYGFKVVGDDSSCINYKYFTWSTVQKAHGTYDFSGIKQFLKDNYGHHNRCALRLFPSCFQESSSIAYNGKKINFPTYVADIMASENAQFVEYKGYWLLDINCEGVYTEYNKLLQAFGEWLNNAIIDDEKNIKAKDVILYIDFGLLGPWGEGGWYDLQMTTTVEKLTRYVKDFATYVPDLQINIGITLSSYKNNFERNEYFIQSKEIKNNAGYIGMFLDNYGTAYPLLFKPNIKVSPHYTVRKLIKKYVQRGDFFTGEFAGFIDVGFWGGNIFLNTYNAFVLFKQPYIRMHNMTVETTKDSYSIRKISPQTYYVLNNVLSCVGFRYVMSVLNTKVGATSVNIEWELTNIGLNKCFFNIYELYYRVHNTDGTVIDTKINYDLRTLKPWNDIPLLFAIGNGKYFSAKIPITDKTKDVSIIVKDVKGIQSPLYLSNYGRQEDGSYLLWEK